MKEILDTIETLLRAYVRMLRAHEARETTVLIPQMREVMNATAFSELYDAIAQKETDILGSDGLYATIDELTDLESALEIRALEQFTARV